MTQKANPSVNRPAEAYKTAGAIAYGGHGSGGWISKSSDPTEISVQDSQISESNLNAFQETSSSSSFDVTIAGGEAFIFGSWVAIDTSTTVSLASSTNNQTVYVGWNKGGSNDVIVGLDAAFSSSSGDTDERIPLFDFNTDGSGVTNVNDRRQLGKTINGRIDRRTTSTGLDITTSGEQIIFVDSSSGTIQITLSEEDTNDGTNIIVIDSGGNALNNPITIDTEGSSTINGSSSVVVEDNYSAKALASDGNNWYTSGAGAGGGAFKDTDNDVIAELISDFNGIQLADGEFIEFGSGSDFDIRYDSAADDIRWRDKNNSSDRMALERTTGNLSIQGTLTENTSL